MDADALLHAIPMLGQGQKGLFALASMQGHAFKAAMRYQIEGLAFLKHRCEQDMKLVDDLLATGDFNDAFDVYANFCQSALLEYSREAAKVTDIGSKVASDTARQIRREADQAAGDMAAQTVN
ncbi:MAG: phasin family protein [Pseudaminobacter sp.]